MSIKTWKKEFYPVPARKVPEGIPAIEHSLQKWRGLHRKAYRKHKIYFEVNHIRGRGKDKYHRLYINESSCALCVHFLGEGCSHCPIFLAIGKGCQSAYGRWLDTGNPEPMLKVLRQTLAFAKQKEKV